MTVRAESCEERERERVRVAESERYGGEVRRKHVNYMWAAGYNKLQTSNIGNITIK